MEDICLGKLYVSRSFLHLKKKHLNFLKFEMYLNASNAHRKRPIIGQDFYRVELSKNKSVISNYFSFY